MQTHGTYQTRAKLRVKLNLRKIMTQLKLIVVGESMIYLNSYAFE